MGASAATWLLIAYGQGTEADRNQLEAIKTAGTIMLSGGGAGALWLAARRQRTSEIALRQKDIDQALQEHVAQAAEWDAVERRVTELYTKAADQLGSDTAPVRLAGMYALERLAQNNPDQRQTIVNVLCAYLRMPYHPPISHRRTRITAAAPTNAESADIEQRRRSDDDRAAQHENERREQERQVRLTAQRILATHLQRGKEPTAPLPTFWSDIDLDLTGATLIALDFTGCHIRSAQFSEAQFTGEALFSEARFIRRARFGGCRFQTARFSEALFADDAQFSGAQFIRGALFDNAQFFGQALFRGTRFHGGAVFDESRFNGAIRFDRAKLIKGGRFSGAQARIDVSQSVARSLPAGYATQSLTTTEEAYLPGDDGQWAAIVVDSCNA